MSAAILQRIEDFTDVMSPSERWDFLSPAPAMRELSVNPSDLIESLCKEFSHEQLVAARVLVPQQDGLYNPSPILTGNPAQGLFLRRAADESPYDVVNQKGSLGSDVPPALASSNDFSTLAWSGDTKLIFTTFSDDDLAVLRMLGLPCTPAAGLAAMDGQQVRSLCSAGRNLHAGKSASMQLPAVRTGNYRLALVGWRIAEVANKQPAGLLPVVTRMLKAEDVFQLDLSRQVVIWQPSTSEFSRICCAVEFADQDRIRDLLWQSAKRSLVSARKYYARNGAQSVNDYSAVRRELLRSLKRAREQGLQSSHIAKSLEAFNHSFDKSVVEAIIKDAMATADSVERSLLLAAAELMGHWHRSSSLVRATQDGIAGHSRSREETLKPKDLKERLRAVEGLVKIHRELTRGK